MSVTPIVAQLIGADKKKNVAFTVIQGLYVSIIMAFIVIVIGFFIVTPILNAMNLDPDVAQIALDYLVALSIGIFPLFIYTVLRNFIDALGQTRTSMFITLLGLPINVTLNYLLIFGKLGFPDQRSGVAATASVDRPRLCGRAAQGHLSRDGRRK